MKYRVFFIGVALLCIFAGRAGAQTRTNNTTEKIEQLQRQMQEQQQQMLNMQKELEALRAQQTKDSEAAQKQLQETVQQVQTEQERSSAQTLSLLERVKIGGYGSVRYENSSLDDLRSTFTLRRLVLTTAAKITPRLHFFTEVEYERFRKLELERSVGPADNGLEVEQAFEGTDGSEIALEQAWLQYDLTNWVSLRTGAVLVPLGRFNIRHDDNMWNLPRRSLVDKGAPVLPSTAAWDELGVGLVGKTPIGSEGQLDYQFYVVNGVSLDAEIENIILSREDTRGKLEAEVELSPSTGTFNLDNKEAKSLTGRLAWSPLVGHELAGSFYWGRYTPEYLKGENVWSLGFDGLTHVGPIDLEWQYIFTRFEGLKSVARSFAKVVKDQEVAVEEDVSPDLETELEFELANLSKTKHGYWLEARYPFWLESLNDSLLGRGFSNPQFIPTLRMEQVWFPSLLQEAAFEDGKLTEYNTASRFVHRVTAGFAYVPTPLVRFTLAYEYTWTNDGKSLGGVTNFLPARDNEDHAHGLLAGVSFGF
jgi:hypothetical protein